MTRFLRVNLLETDTKTMATELREIADRVEKGAKAGAVMAPHHDRHQHGRFFPFEIDDNGKDVEL